MRSLICLFCLLAFDDDLALSADWGFFGGRTICLALWLVCARLNGLLGHPEVHAWGNAGPLRLFFPRYTRFCPECFSGLPDRYPNVISKRLFVCNSSDVKRTRSGCWSLERWSVWCYFWVLMVMRACRGQDSCPQGFFGCSLRVRDAESISLTCTYHRLC